MCQDVITLKHPSNKVYRTLSPGPLYFNGGEEGRTVSSLGHFSMNRSG